MLTHSPTPGVQGSGQSLHCTAHALYVHDACTRENVEFLIFIFRILSKIFSKGGTLTTKFSLKKHEKMREKSDKMWFFELFREKWLNILSQFSGKNS